MIPAERTDTPAGAGRTAAALWAPLAAAAALRLLPAFLVYGTADTGNWLRYADAIADGTPLNVYADTYINNLPAIPLLSWAASLAATASGFPFHFLIKLPAIAGDLLICLLLFRGFGGPRAAWLHALNPVAILVSGVHGQFEPLVGGLSLAAASFGTARPVLAGALLGAALSLKSYAVLFLPVLLAALPRGNRIRFAAAFTAVPALLSLPFLASAPADMLRDVFGYASRFGSWGYTLLAETVSKRPGLGAAIVFKDLGMAWGKYFLLSALAGYYLMWYRSGRYAETCAGLTGVLLVFYSFTAGFGIQYLCLILPFAAAAGGGAGPMTGDRRLILFSLFSAAWMTSWYLHVLPGGLYDSAIAAVGESIYWKAATALSLAAWAFCLAWLAAHLREISKARS